MRQVWMMKTGNPLALQMQDAPDPLPGPGQVRIRVRACGVNFADIMARLGLYPDAPKPPAVLGYEISGVVDAIGENVQTRRKGERVVALTNFGGYSDVLCVPTKQVFKIPDSLSFEKAATIPVNYLTAWITLIYMGNLRSGETVLIHGIAGGVGQAALQICSLNKATVIGTAGVLKHDRLKQLGVSHCIDSRSKNFKSEVMEITGGNGVDMVLDPIGGASYSKSYNCLKLFGRLYMYGVSSLAPRKTRTIPAVLWGLLRMPSFRSIRLMNHNRSVCGINLGRLWKESDKLSSMLDLILDRVQNGDLDPLVDKTFNLEQAALAHGYMQDRKNFGKVLLIPENP